MSLYDPVLVKHAKAPYGFAPASVNRREDSGAIAAACDTNRTCGDRICFEVAASPSAETLVVRFEGEGCALAIGAASALCEAVDGRPLAEAKQLVTDFARALSDASQEAALVGDLAHFARARVFPARVACVSLGSAVLSTALDRFALEGGSDVRRYHDR